MKRFFDRQRNRLAFFRKKADRDFWDAHWKKVDIEKSLENIGPFSPIVFVTRRYLNPSDGIILEGGCGIGRNVAALSQAGYECLGVDFAGSVIEKVQAIRPDLDVRFGNVEDLGCNEGRFAGYWSLGVIEHFVEGYDRVLREAKRVLRPGGILFLSFPHMSPLRRMKARMNQYPLLEEKKDGWTDFYQFALNHREVVEHAQGLGFCVLRRMPLSGIKGTKDEIPLLRGLLQNLFDMEAKTRLTKCIKVFVDIALSYAGAGHMMLLVMRAAKSQ